MKKWIGSKIEGHSLSYMKNSLLFLLFAVSCSPIKSSPKEEKHQLELTLHELQTNLDDLRHDVHCVTTDIQLLDGKISHHENILNSLKQQTKQDEKLQDLKHTLLLLEKKIASLQAQETLKNLTDHANETTLALKQHKQRIAELEKELITQERKYEELTKLAATLESLKNAIPGDGVQIKLYKVKAGDSLEKIAKNHQITVEYIKKLNQLDQDLIYIDQELKIPISKNL